MTVFHLYLYVFLASWILIYLFGMKEEKTFFPFDLLEIFGLTLVTAGWPLFVLYLIKEIMVLIYNLYQKRLQRLTYLREMIERKYEWYD